MTDDFNDRVTVFLSKMESGRWYKPPSVHTDVFIARIEHLITKGEPYIIREDKTLIRGLKSERELNLKEFYNLPPETWVKISDREDYEICLYNIQHFIDFRVNYGFILELDKGFKKVRRIEIV